MTAHQRQAREFRTSALNLRKRAQDVGNAERAAAWRKEAGELEAEANKLDPLPKKPQS